MQLQLLGADAAFRTLFEPNLVALSAREFDFIDFERHETAWVLQQWDCELLGP